MTLQSCISYQINAQYLIRRCRLFSKNQRYCVSPNDVELVKRWIQCFENLFKRQNHIQYHSENVLRKCLSRKLLGTRSAAVNTLVRASLILCNKTGRLLTMKISRCDLYKLRRRQTHTNTSVTRCVRHTSAVFSLIVICTPVA